MEAKKHERIPHRSVPKKREWSLPVQVKAPKGLTDSDWDGIGQSQGPAVLEPSLKPNPWIEKMKKMEGLMEGVEEGRPPPKVRHGNGGTHWSQTWANDEKHWSRAVAKAWTENQKIDKAAAWKENHNIGQPLAAAQAFTENQKIGQPLDAAGLESIPSSSSTDAQMPYMAPLIPQSNKGFSDPIPLFIDGDKADGSTVEKTASRKSKWDIPQGSNSHLMTQRFVSRYRSEKVASTIAEFTEIVKCAKDHKPALSHKQNQATKDVAASTSDDAAVVAQRKVLAPFMDFDDHRGVTGSWTSTVYDFGGTASQTSPTTELSAPEPQEESRSRQADLNDKPQDPESENPCPEFMLPPCPLPRERSRSREADPKDMRTIKILGLGAKTTRLWLKKEMEKYGEVLVVYMPHGRQQRSCQPGPDTPYVRFSSVSMAERVFAAANAGRIVIDGKTISAELGLDGSERIKHLERFTNGRQTRSRDLDATSLNHAQRERHRKRHRSISPEKATRKSSSSRRDGEKNCDALSVQRSKTQSKDATKKCASRVSDGDKKDDALSAQCSETQSSDVSNQSQIRYNTSKRPVFEEEIVDFIIENEIDDEASVELWEAAPEVQRMLLDGGSLKKAANPSAALIDFIHTAVF
eukprot:gnl/MRDRNA2_/MRDRNA2_72474_c0_seq1.p1 gnl/MRDRNA2_/MRDRNA2_72474_c0~~gnl/MRDRNA2_/MRDRNA2_72474_c0_seq1.p1  ORF type:complete len:635 (+),score=117.84 gnl/MRDRNA2_/MRDRNA2_72474_c0_seq1:204-2108(+)